MKKKSLIITASLLTSIALFLPNLRAQSNVAPTIDSITTATSSGGADISTLTPSENGTTSIYIHGAATDTNGCEDIDTKTNWTVAVYRSDVSGNSGCTADNNDCYQPNESSVLNFAFCDGAEDNELYYEAMVNLEHYADPTDTGSPHAGTDWSVFVEAKDDGDLSDTANDNFELASLIALNVTGNVNYGNISLGANSDEQTITFTNTGNRDIDVDFNGDGDLICDDWGSIPVGNLHLSLNTGFVYGVGDQALTTSAQNLDLSLSQRTDEVTPNTKNAYAIVKMPETGISGTCSNTITFTAKADG